VRVPLSSLIVSRGKHLLPHANYIVGSLILETIHFDKTLLIEEDLTLLVAFPDCALKQPNVIGNCLRFSPFVNPVC
jgi:hypothetical protein